MRLKYHTPLAVSVAIKHACMRVIQRHRYNGRPESVSLMEEVEDKRRLIDEVGEAVRQELIEN